MSNILSTNKIKSIQPNTNDYHLKHVGYQYLNKLRCSYQHYTSKISAKFEANEIDIGVYLGNITSSCDINSLKENNILPGPQPRVTN